MALSFGKILASLFFCLAVSVSFAAASGERESRSVQGGESLERVGKEDKEAASRLLAFRNEAAGALGEGYYSQADTIQRHVKAYLEDWKLPPLSSKAFSRKKALAKLTPPKGLFNEAEEKALAQSLEGMDKALGKMLEDFRALASYVADNTIRDDGKLGRELGGKLDAGHAQFTEARKAWLAIVEARAEEAEKLLLRGDPLERQIISARRIFTLFNQVAAILVQSAESGAELPRAELENLRASLIIQIAEGAKPPFPGAAALERNYRAFLKQAQAYENLLAQGLERHFPAIVRQSLNETAQKCRKAYNAFAQAANQAN